MKRFLVCLLLAGFVLTGCSVPDAPDPVQSAMDTAVPATSPQSADSIQTEEPSLPDDLDLLAEAVRGLTDLEVEALLGKPDAQGSGTFSYGYNNSDGTKTVIFFERENRTVLSIKNPDRYITLQPIERSSGARAILDDPALLLSEVDGKDFLVVRELLGDPNEVLYTPSRSDCFLNSDGKTVRLHFNGDEIPVVIGIEFDGQVLDLAEPESNS